jgi:hypothetical protein
VPLTLAELTTRLAVPVFWIAIDCVPEVPTLTFPNARFAGVTETVGVAAVTPVALSGRTLGEVEALLLMVRLPAELPAAEGAKLMATVADVFGATARPGVSPLVEKPLPDTETCEIVRFAFPVFDTVTDLVAVEPTVTDPKERACWLRVIPGV